METTAGKSRRTNIGTIGPSGSGAGSGTNRMDIYGLNEFPHRLQRLRERRRINRKVLGELCGLSKNTIGQYERGEREPTISSLIKIADFFEVSTDYLLGRQNFL